MCGIAGYINFDKNLDQILQKSLYHRGPDKQTSYKFDNVNLVHTRLSIQDIKNGNQPFELKNFVLVFNGEIYNHMELRKVYLKNSNFVSHSDAETLVHLYEKYNTAMLDLLDGMFAFAILDKKKNKLIFARDRAGKKPLYLYQNNKNILFASELRALKNVLDLTIDEEQIQAYLRNGFFSGKTTAYRDVIELEPGYCYQLDIKNLKLQKKQYFNILDYYKKDKITDFDKAIVSIDSALHKSVKDRLFSSDLEVGAFLSGGIDSSLIVAIASEYVDKLKTFTVKFDGSFDESKLAKLTAEKYNTDHTEIPISMNLRDDIETILCNYGEPFMDSSAVPSYYASQEAKKHTTIVLNGDGADELFGGYRRYVPIANNWIRFVKYFSLVAKILPKSNKKRSNFNNIYRLLKLSEKKGLDFYNSATYDIFEDVYSFDSLDTFEQMGKVIESLDRENISNLSKILIMDFNFILPSDHLKKMDIATMANSLEGRSPFLSKYMLELVPMLDDKFKVKGINTKVILRQLGKKYLSKDLINQPKRGFEVPLKKWVNGELRDNILDSLTGDYYSKNFLPKGFIEKLIANKIDTSDEKRAKMLWTMYCLEVWKKNLAKF
jgi:asparagine synthase (glutamine-hydrolysing)